METETESTHFNMNYGKENTPFLSVYSFSERLFFLTILSAQQNIFKSHMAFKCVHMKALYWLQYSPHTSLSE